MGMDLCTCAWVFVSTAWALRYTLRGKEIGRRVFVSVDKTGSCMYCTLLPIFNVLVPPQVGVFPPHLSSGAIPPVHQASSLLQPVCGSRVCVCVACVHECVCVWVGECGCVGVGVCALRSLIEQPVPLELQCKTANGWNGWCVCTYVCVYVCVCVYQ